MRSQLQLGSVTWDGTGGMTTSYTKVWCAALCASCKINTVGSILRLCSVLSLQSWISSALRKIIHHGTTSNLQPIHPSINLFNLQSTFFSWFELSCFLSIEISLISWWFSKNTCLHDSDLGTFQWFWSSSYYLMSSAANYKILLSRLRSFFCHWSI